MTDQTTAPPEFLTTAQVTVAYPIFEAATLRYWRHNNTGPASFNVGRKVLYRRSEIERWIAEQEKATTRGGAA